MSPQTNKFAYASPSDLPQVTTLEADGGVTILTIARVPHWLRVLDLIGGSVGIAVQVAILVIGAITYMKFRAFFVKNGMPMPAEHYFQFDLIESIAGIIYVSIMGGFTIRNFMRPPAITHLRISGEGLLLVHRRRSRFWSRDQIKAVSVSRERDIFTRKKSFFINIRIRRKWPIRLPLRTRDDELLGRLESSLKQLTATQDRES